MKKLFYIIFPALLLISRFSIETFAQGPQGGELVRTSEIFTSEDYGFCPPDQEYMDENGNVYHLESWHVIQLPDEKIEKLVEDVVVYDKMEYTEAIPPTTEISIYNEYTGEIMISEFPICEVVCLEERWEDGLKLPVTYHDYHSDAYQLGEYLIMPDEDQPKLDGWENVLLAMAGLPESDYRIKSVNWKGQPYQDESGHWRRDAMASGEKRLCDYQVRYGGSTVLTKPGGMQWEAVYRLVEQPVESFNERVIQAESAEAEPEHIQTPFNWKVWVKTTVIITVAIGFLLMLTVLIIWAVSWLKKRRKNKKIPRHLR